MNFSVPSSSVKQLPWGRGRKQSSSQFRIPVGISPKWYRSEIFKIMKWDTEINGTYPSDKKELVYPCSKRTQVFRRFYWCKRRNWICSYHFTYLHLGKSESLNDVMMEIPRDIDDVSLHALLLWLFMIYSLLEESKWTGWSISQSWIKEPSSLFFISSI